MSDYRPDIDGLRAVAVVPVVLFHAGFPAFSGGYVGVDVFFVISGFLITRKIAEEIQDGTFSIAWFYERRIRRIVPALIAILLFVALVSVALLPPDELIELGYSIVAAALSVSNILFWAQTDYFATAADDIPLLHTWSLGVEEQYYFVFPLILLSLFRLRGGRFVTVGVVLMASLSLAAAVAFIAQYQPAVFYLSPFRFWELLVGSLLAIAQLPLPSRRSVREVAVWVGLAMIAVSIFLYTEETLFPGTAALVPCLGAALVIYAGLDGRRSFGGGLLASWVPVKIGLISYSLYLWHWPLIVFSQYMPFESGWSTKAGVVLLSFVAAALSWRFVEQPFRSRRAISRRPLFAFATAAIGACVLFGAFVDLAGGLPGRFPPGLVGDIPGKQFYNRDCLLEPEQSYESWRGEECFLSRSGRKNVLLWGDSHAAHYVPGFREYGQDWNVLQYTASACAPIQNYDPKDRPNCADINKYADQIIDDYDLDAVVLSANWIATRTDEFSGLQETVDKLLAHGLDVIVIGQVPVFDHNPKQLYRATEPDPLTGSYFAETRDNSRAFSDELKAFTRGALYINPFDFSDCREDDCPFLDATGFLKVDRIHLSKHGSELAMSRYFPIMRNFLDHVE